MPHSRKLRVIFLQALIVWGNFAETATGIDGDPAAVSPDGSRVAIIDDADVLIVDCNTSELVSRCSGHLDDVSVCSWSPDGRRLATGSLDRTLRLWDADAGALSLALVGHQDHGESFTYGGHRMVWGAVTDCAWSSDGERLVSAGSDRLLITWDTRTGEALARLQGHVGPVVGCAWSDDNRRVVSRGGTFEHIQDGSVRLWDACHGVELGEIPPDAAAAEALDLHKVRAGGGSTFGSPSASSLPSPDRLWSATTESDRWRTDKIMVRSRKTGEERELPVDETTDRVHLAWYPDSRHLAVASDQLIVFDVAERTAIMRAPLRASATRLHIVNAGTGLLVGDHERLCRIFTVEGLDASGPGHAVPIGPREEPADSLVRPLAEEDPVAWLRLLRGMLVNQKLNTAESIRRAYASLVAHDTTEGTFEATIVDPFSPSIDSLNAEVWYFGAIFLWYDQRSAERCLRTALERSAEHSKSRALLGWLLVETGRNGEADEYFDQCDDETVIAVAEMVLGLDVVSPDDQN